MRLTLRYQTIHTRIVGRRYNRLLLGDLVPADQYFHST